jgi:O-antigen ligase
MSRLVSFLLYLALVVVCIGVSARTALDYLTETRGVESPTLAAAPTLGTNTALERYTNEAELTRALVLIKSARLTAIRQPFLWREIEPTRGNFDWAKWDRIVEQAGAAGLQIVAVLDTAPAWAQRDDERDLPNAPPDDFADYANFAGEFARRYGSQIHYYEIWDEPNIHPSWGRRNANPEEYGRLLNVAAAAIRSDDAHAKIVLAGLGMSLETQRPHPDYSEILFLRGLYEAGAQNDFDVVAAKPFGMWTGPEDRRISTGVLNFSRVILLRDEMKQHGDVAKPVWGVEMGWNSLPGDWAGLPSPWGSDAEAVQADRLTRALARAYVEWGWMGGLFPQMFQPDAPVGDPRWGFALVTRDLQPRPFYTALVAFASKPPLSAPPSRNAPWLPLALLGAAAIVATWRSVLLLPATPLPEWWRALETGFAALPELAQFAILAFAVAAFYSSPSVPLNLVLLALLIPLFALRLDLGLTLLVFAIPFFLYPKTVFAGFDLSLVEVLTLVGITAWVWRAVFANPPLSPLRKGGQPTTPPFSKGGQGGVGSPGPYSLLVGTSRLQALARLSSLDWAIILFVLLGIISTRVAANFGVASREFRVIVLEPGLLYALLRIDAWRLSRTQVWRLVNGLLLAGVVVCLIGLFQFASGDVIVGAGVGRVRAVWGSPNNAALFLGRLLPLALGLVLFLPRSRRRWLYAALAALLAITIYLTYSLGALVLGVPASVASVVLVWLWQSPGRLRASRAAVLGVLVIAAMLLIGFAGRARLESLFQPGTGTGFFRVAVWTSALHMIRDHPLFGVGLDNFLYEYSKYILPEAWREPNLSHPHNVLLDFWVRLGILGVAILVWIEVEFFRRAWRLFRENEDLTRALAVGLMASMVDFLAHGMIDAAYFVVDLAFVFMLTVGLVARLTAERKWQTADK